MFGSKVRRARRQYELERLRSMIAENDRAIEARREEEALGCRLCADRFGVPV